MPYRERESPLSMLRRKLSPTLSVNSSYQMRKPLVLRASTRGRTNTSLSSLAWQTKASQSEGGLSFVATGGRIDSIMPRSLKQGVADTRKRTLKNKLVFRSENLCGPNQVSGFHTQIVRVPRVAGPDLGLLVPSAETKPINFGSEESLQFGLA